MANKPAMRRNRRKQRTNPPTQIIPHSIKPPADPPTIASNKPRTAWIILPSKVPDTLNSVGVTAATVAAEITKQYGVSTGIRFQIQKVYVYGPLNGSNVSIRDELTGISSSDSGSASNRPCAGLLYPPPSQGIQDGGVGATKWSALAYAASNSTIEAYIKVKFWIIPDLSVIEP